MLLVNNSCSFQYFYISIVIDNFIASFSELDNARTRFSYFDEFKLAYFLLKIEISNPHAVYYPISSYM